MNKLPAEQVIFRFNCMVDTVRTSKGLLEKRDVETIRACADYVIQTSGWTRVDFVALLMSVDPYPRAKAATAA